MSWLDKVNNIQLKIVTGDGKEYTPKWKNAVKNIDFNVKGYDYPGVEGTFVNRKKVSGTKYPIELFFDGENHLDTAKAFEVFARDNRSWTLTHPYYDIIKVQPTSLSINQNSLSVTVITGNIWETIENKFPNESKNVVKEVAALKFQNDAAVAAVFAEKVGVPEAATVQSAEETVNKISINYEKLPATNATAVKLKNYVRSASAAAQEYISKPTRYVEQLQQLINFPFEIEQNIQLKLVSLRDSISDLGTLLMGIDSIPGENLLYEVAGFGLITAASATAVSADYANREDVLAAANRLEDSYLDLNTSFESADYLMDAGVVIDADNVYNLTQGNLIQIAFESAQERKLILEKDSNPVSLTHRFYGAGDDNLNKFIDQNALTIDELLQIKKGREIIYYV